MFDLTLSHAKCLMNMVVALHAVQQVSLALHLGHRGNAPFSLSPGLGLLQLSGAMKLFLVNIL